MRYPVGLHVRIGEDLDRLLTDEAKREDLNVSDIVRRALREHARRRQVEEDDEPKPANR